MQNIRTHCLLEVKKKREIPSTPELVLSVILLTWREIIPSGEESPMPSKKQIEARWQGLSQEERKHRRRQYALAGTGAGAIPREGLDYSEAAKRRPRTGRRTLSEAQLGPPADRKGQPYGSWTAILKEGYPGKDTHAWNRPCRTDDAVLGEDNAKTTR